MSSRGFIAKMSSVAFKRMEMEIEVLKPGMRTTVQDLGRWGQQRIGISVSGAMDALALRLGNNLVGNEEREAAFECTLIGPVLRFPQARLIAITGADLGPCCDGAPIPLWKAVYMPEGSVLSFSRGTAKSGCHTYICVAGGLAIPEVLGSKSTYLAAGFGGWEGRALVEGDRIPLIKESELSLKTRPETWGIGRAMFQSRNAQSRIIRVMEGPEFEAFDDTARDDFFRLPFSVTGEADRTGYRLDGPSLMLKKPLELLSTAVAFGTIQVPAAGKPILLMADRQTTGGYPRVAQVIRADLPACGQLRPGDEIRFQPVGLREAQSLLLEQERAMARLRCSIDLKRNDKQQ